MITVKFLFKGITSQLHDDPSKEQKGICPEELPQLGTGAMARPHHCILWGDHLVATYSFGLEGRLPESCVKEALSPAGGWASLGMASCCLILLQTENKEAVKRKKKKKKIAAKVIDLFPE